MKKSKHPSLGQILVLATLAMPATVMAQKTPQLRLDAPPLPFGFSRFPRIAASGDSVYVTWQGDQSSYGSATDIYFNRSLDGGATWLPADIRLDSTPPASSHSEYPAIAASGQSVYVVWTDGRTGKWNTFFNRSLDGGATWQSTDTRLNLGQAASRFLEPVRIAAAGDAVYVIWEDSRHGGKALYFDRSLDRGATWLSTDIRLDTNSRTVGGVWEPQMAVSGDSVYVVWRGSGGNRYQPYFNRSLDQGDTWLDEVLILDQLELGSISRPQIAAAEDSVYVTWQDDRNGNSDIYINRSHDRGTRWRFSGTRIDTDTPPGVRKSRNPQIVASGSAVYVTWGEKRLGYHLAFNRSLDRGVTWLPAEIALDSQRPGTASSIEGAHTVVFGDSVFAAWIDYRPSAPGVYFNRSLDQGTTWLGSDVRLNSDSSRSLTQAMPNIAATDESVYVTWGEITDGRYSIYFTIPFGAQAFGKGTRGSSEITPKLEGTDSLTLGSTFTLSISNGLGGAFGLLALGGPNSKTSIPMLGGNLLIDPIDRILPIRLQGPLNAPGAGTLSIDCPIPDDPAFLGFNINMQALLIDPGSTSGVAWTNAVEAWIL